MLAILQHHLREALVNHCLTLGEALHMETPRVPVSLFLEMMIGWKSGTWMLVSGPLGHGARGEGAGRVKPVGGVQEFS